MSSKFWNNFLNTQPQSIIERAFIFQKYLVYFHHLKVFQSRPSSIYLQLFLFVRQMSSREPQQQQHPRPTQPNPLYRFNPLHERERQLGRANCNKNRFPPKKKDNYLKKQGKTSVDAANQPDTKNDNRNLMFVRALQTEVNFSLQKANAGGTMGNYAPYHAVGQSQREKIMGVSPFPHASMNETSEATRETTS